MKTMSKTVDTTDPAEFRPHKARPEYLRRREAARFLGLAPSTLANWLCAGKGPAVHHVGRVPLYDLAELRRFVGAGRVETVAPR